MKKIGFIGMGNMATSIVGGCVNSKWIDASNIYAYDIDQIKLQTIHEQYHINVAINEQEIDVVNQVDIIVLAIKPNVVESVIKKIKDSLDNKVVVSIVAGYDFNKYQELLLATTRHISVMPNTPALVKQGMTLLEKENTLTKEEMEFVSSMFASFGKVEVLPSYQMKAGGAISGCGPAFVYMMIEALADGGVKQGLPRDVAYRLASQTIIGAGTMQRETNIHPAILKDNVCSPGGITIKGVQALEDHNFRAAVIAAIEKSS